MERVDAAVLHCATRRHQSLRRHLTAEDPLSLLVWLGAPEDVHLNRLEVEQVHQEIQRVTHLTPIIAGADDRRRPACPPAPTNMTNHEINAQKGPIPAREPIDHPG